MPLFPSNNGFQIPASTKNTLENSDYILVIDGNGTLCKITKTDLLAGLSSVSGTTIPTSSPTNIVLLSHFEGANNSNIFTDVKGHTLTANGTPVISTNKSKFGESSLFLNGDSFLSVVKDSTLSFGSNDFTFECWIYLYNNPSTANYMAIMGNAAGYTGGNAGCFLAIHQGKLIFRHWIDANSNASSIANITTGLWHHVAISRVGMATNVFLDGIKGNQGSIESTNFDNSFTIGAVPDNSGYAQNFIGFIDEVRVSNGIALYTSDFTPSTQPFSNS